MLWHGKAVEPVCRFHSAAAVRDYNELRSVAVTLYVFGESRDVYLVKCRFYLVEYTEGVGFTCISREEGYGDEGFSPPESCIAVFLSFRGCRLDLDAGI